MAFDGDKNTKRAASVPGTQPGGKTGQLPPETFKTILKSVNDFL